MPKVSVIIPTYNRSHVIYRSIQSVLNQTYQDFEIIVVDDGSTDNTEDVIRNFNDSRIIYIRHNDNKGVAAARNTGIKASKSEYIAFQDSDDEWFSEKLNKQIEAFEMNPEIGIIYTDMLRINKEGEIKYWHSPTVSYGHIINPKTMDYQFMGLGIVSTLIKRECFNKVGDLDENFPRFEDLEIFIRLSKHYHFHHIKEPLVSYYATDDGISSNNTTLHIARKLLLEKYIDDDEMEGKFLANQYFLIGYALQTCGRFTDAKSYFIKAITKNPTSVKLLLIGLISSFGQKTFAILIKVYKNMNI
ncbi:glycosyltransferase [Candidatus Pacearchaeota archaeon]|nr:glycosyltransferase [Candidatus Pacearchaeota archaeon]